MDPDINKYDLDHRVAHHSKMTDQEWEDAYRAAWEDLLYARAHPHDPQARGPDPERPAEADHEHDHVVQAHDRAGGRASARRRRFPAQIPPRPPAAACRWNRRFVFYPRYWGGIAVKAWHYSRFFLRTRRILKEVLNAPDRWTYTDLAIAPPRDDEFEQLSLYHATSGGEAALARKALGDSIRDSARRPRRRDIRRRRRNDLKAMIEAAQVRAARALIGWSQAKLAETAGVPVSTINEFETGAPDHFADEAVDKMRAALEAAGVVFIPKNGGGGIGVRLREALEGEYIGWNDLNASNDE